MLFNIPPSTQSLLLEQQPGVSLTHKTNLAALLRYTNHSMTEKPGYCQSITLSQRTHTHTYLLILSCLANLHWAPATSTFTIEVLKFSVLSKPKLRPQMVTVVEPLIGPEDGNTCGNAEENGSIFPTKFWPTRELKAVSHSIRSKLKKQFLGFRKDQNRTTFNLNGPDPWLEV